MSKYLDENDLYYENEKYDKIFKNLMIHNINTNETEMPKDKYYDNNDYNDHFENVYYGIADGKSYDENQKYYDDTDMNKLFIDTFVKDAIKEVSNEAEFTAAVNSLVKTVKLTADISTATNIAMENGKEKVFDLNGKTLTYSGTANIKVGGSFNTQMGTGGCVTFKNGTLNLGAKAIRVFANCTTTDRQTSVRSILTLGNNLTLKSSYGSGVIGVMGLGAELYIDENCGTVEATADGNLIIGDSSAQCSGTKITVNGGDFKVTSAETSLIFNLPQQGETNITGGTYNKDVSAYLKPEYECVEVSTGVWKVRKK